MLNDTFGAPLDKCALMDILVYFEANGAIARHLMVTEFSDTRKPLWKEVEDDDLDTRPVDVIDDQSFRFRAELNCAHPIDLEEEVWYEPLVFGINVVGHWDRKRGS